MADQRKIGAVEIDRLFNFLDGLQASGYIIDPRQYLALSDLLMALIARGDSLDELPLKTLIAPLICVTPAEQQDFYQRFDRWYPTLLPVKQASLSGDGIALPPPPKPRWSLPTINRTAVIWVTVVVAVIALFFWLISNSAVTGTQVVNSTVSLYGAIFAVFGFMVWLGWRASILYQENQYITRELANQEPVYTKVPVKAYIQDVMSVMQFKPIVSALRKRIQIPSSEVDVDRTIENALNRNNWLEIVYHQRQVMPEYVVLIDRKSRLDQQARFVQEVLAKLAADGVWLHQYEFSGDPRICFPLDRKDTPLRLKDLQSRHPDTRLLIFSGTNELINPLTGLLQDWLESLLYWQERAILTPDKLQKVLLEELQSRDFAVLPMTFDGLASLVHVFETDNAPLLTNGGTGLPTQLNERPMRWTGREAPPEAEVKALVDDVRNYLGENGFYWLCATAVYPELRWELTLHLGNELKDDLGQSLLNPDLLIRLARLPWFRFGYMPDWFRSGLIKNFSSQQEVQVRDILSKLLISAYNGQGFDLRFAQKSKNKLTPKFLNALIRNSSDESSLHDSVFIKFVVNSGLRKLAISLPSRLRELIFPNSRRNFSMRWLQITKSLAGLIKTNKENLKNIKQQIIYARNKLLEVAQKYFTRIALILTLLISSLGALFNLYRIITSSFSIANFIFLFVMVIIFILALVILLWYSVGSSPKEKSDNHNITFTHPPEALESRSESDISLWGVAGSGKSWLIYALARELAWYTDNDSNFSYSFKDSDDQYILSLQPPSDAFLAPTLESEDHWRIFERKGKIRSHSHKVSSHAHSIVIHDNPGSRLVSDIEEYSSGYDTIISTTLKASKNIIILLDPTSVMASSSLNTDSIGLFSKSEYGYLISKLVQTALSNADHIRLAVCLSKSDLVKVRLPVEELVRVMFGEGTMRALSSSRVEKKFFRVSSVGYIRSNGERVPNIDPSSGKLRDEFRWHPINVVSPFFWFFESIERERISKGDFLGDRTKIYIPYPPPRQT